MINKIVIVVSFILCTKVGYSQQAFTKDELQYYLPQKQLTFKLSSVAFTLSDTFIVSSNAVYVTEMIEEEREKYEVIKTVKSYLFIRFFDDGKVFFSFSYLSFPSEEEFNDLNYGKFGRYIITKNGDIKIELYMDKKDGLTFIFAEKNTSGIQFYKTAGMIGRSRDKTIYSKTYCKLYNWPD